MPDVEALITYTRFISGATIYSGSDISDNGVLPDNLGDIRYFALGGNDALEAVTVDELVDGGAGDDDIDADFGGISAGADWLDGGSGNDILLGCGGNDWIMGGSGGDAIHGEAGADRLYGGSGGDYISAGDDDDYIVGGAGNDFVDGGAGNDTLLLEGDLGVVTFNSANDGSSALVHGGGGADRFVVAEYGLGSGALQWPAGAYRAFNLIYPFDPNEAGEVIDLSRLQWIGGMAQLSIGNFSFNNNTVTRITTTDGVRSLYLTLWAVSASELGAEHFVFAAPRITGTHNANTLAGDAGGNYLDGGSEADSLEGRTGDDTYVIDHEEDSIIELAGGGFDHVESAVSFTLSAELENLTLTGSADINAVGNSQSNRIRGNSGANRIDGATGADVMIGGNGDDAYVVDQVSRKINECVNHLDWCASGL